MHRGATLSFCQTQLHVPRIMPGYSLLLVSVTLAVGASLLAKVSRTSRLSCRHAVWSVFLYSWRI